jgi:hypothetical protein
MNGSRKKAPIAYMKLGLLERCVGSRRSSDCHVDSRVGGWPA